MSVSADAYSNAERAKGKFGKANPVPAGILPVDVRALDLDFATGGSVKWLCGGPGAGYLYVRRDLWPRLKPAATGWAK